MRRGLAAVAGAVAFLIVVPQAAAFQSTYRVVSVTHSSGARKNESPVYTGSSTSTWSLAPPTKKAPNLLEVQVNGPIVLGIGTVNVRGVFKAQARSNRPGNCSLTAPTGSKRYPLVAPGPFQLVVSPDPKARNRVLVSHGILGNRHASLGNPYFPSECSTSTTGEPDAEDVALKLVPKSTFSQKTVVLRYQGATNKSGIAYRWSTVFTLKRIKYMP